MVSKASIRKISDDHYVVNGELLMNTVMSVLNEMDASLKKQTCLHVDFSMVTNSDSAAVALIIAWLSKAKQSGVDIKLSELPQQIIDITKASDLLDILPIE